MLCPTLRSALPSQVVASCRLRWAERDTQAIHAKLNELLRAEGRARCELALLDGEELEVIEAQRVLRIASIGIRVQAGMALETKGSHDCRPMEAASHTNVA
jgi:low affinity Fe/Cu permease